MIAYAKMARIYAVCIVAFMADNVMATKWDDSRNAKAKAVCAEGFAMEFYVRSRVLSE
jgi:hypothetical protein